MTPKHLLKGSTALSERLSILKATLLPSDVEKRLESFSDDVMSIPSPMTPNALMSLIYPLASDYMRVFESHTVCSKGCDDCCSYAVTVSEIEAAYIFEMTGREYRTPRKHPNPTKAYFGVGCPFKDTKSKLCSIYEYRPLACRLYATFDNPKYCSYKYKKPHHTHAMNGSAFWTNVMDNLIMISKKNGSNTGSADIREWFANKK